jgi:oligopeptide transport system substrate-binding protein
MVIAVACSDERAATTSREVTVPTTPSAGESAVAPAASPPETPSAAPTRKARPEDGSPEVLRVAVSPPTTLDPMRIADPGSVLIARQLFEGLTRWDPMARWVVPAAAASWTVSDGGTTFEFELRDGMSFHDGTPVTAHHFKFAFDRIARKSNASEIAYTLDRIQGFVEYNQLGKGRGLRGVTAIDDSTLRIRLSEPHYDFPAVLTHPGLVPVQRRAVRNIDRFVRSPVGNGPFQMRGRWEPGAEVVLDAFPRYREPPAVDRVHFLPYSNPAHSWSAFQAGQIDVAEVPVDEVEDASAVYGAAGTKPLLAGYFYGVNMRAGVLSDIRLRKAINFAIDREAIAQQIYEGTLRPPRGVVPWGMPGFAHNACKRLCVFSPERARALVRRVPKNSRGVVVEFTKGRPHGEVARRVASDLRDVGLRVKLRPYEFTQYVARLARGDGRVYRYGWLAEYPDPDVFLTPVFDSGSPENYSGFDSERVDRLLDRARSEPDPARRLLLYRRAEMAILKRVPVIPIGSFVTHWAAQPRVESLAFDTAGGFDLVGASIED